MAQTQKESGQTPELSQHPETFFDTHRDTLDQIFEITGLGTEQTGSLEAVVNATQPWVRGDHGHDSFHFNFDDEQKHSLMQLYDKLDIAEQRDLPAGHYDHILILGAVHLGNDKRVSFLKNMVDANGVTADKIFLMGGERSIFTKREPEDVVRSLERLEAKGELKGWLTELIEKPYIEVNETDMLRIAMLDRLGPLALTGSSSKSTENAQAMQYDEFDWNGTPVLLTHTRAVTRKDGAARHTTEACIADWFRTFEPQDTAQVGFIGSQPHLDRMIRAAERKLRSLGSNLHFIAGGPGVSPETGHTIYLGEVARQLYEDLQLQKSN